MRTPPAAACLKVSVSVAVCACAAFEGAQLVQASPRLHLGASSQALSSQTFSTASPRGGPLGPRLGSISAHNPVKAPAAHADSQASQKAAWLSWPGTLAKGFGRARDPGAQRVVVGDVGREASQVYGDAKLPEQREELCRDLVPTQPRAVPCTRATREFRREGSPLAGESEIRAEHNPKTPQTLACRLISVRLYDSAGAWCSSTDSIQSRGQGRDWLNN